MSLCSSQNHSKSPLRKINRIKCLVTVVLLTMDAEQKFVDRTLTQELNEWHKIVQMYAVCSPTESDLVDCIDALKVKFMREM